MGDAAAEVAVEMVSVDEESALGSAVPAGVDVDGYAVEAGVAGGLDAASADELVARLAERVRAGEGLSLVGEGGLLAQLTRRFVEAAAEGEMDAHLGYAKHDAAGRDGGMSVPV